MGRRARSSVRFPRFGSRILLTASAPRESRVIRSAVSDVGDAGPAGFADWPIEPVRKAFGGYSQPRRRNM
jgi:hypothetical protein